MKKNLLLLSVTAALISACGAATPPTPVTLNTLTLGGVSGPLRIDAPAKLTVTAVGSDGNAFAGTPTFTSSDPNVVSVAADGTLSVRHLSTRPVTLTVAEAGKTATLDVKTYGLDFTGGTYNQEGLPLYGLFLYRIVNAAGNAVIPPTGTTVTIQGPSGYNKGAAQTAPTAPTSTALVISDALPVSGNYSTTITAEGVTYSKTFALDAASVLPLPSGIKTTSTAANVTATGTVPAGTTSLQAVAYSLSSKAYVATSTALNVTLPDTKPWPSALPSGSYELYNIARTYSTGSGDPFPDQVNYSFGFTGTATLP